MNGDLSETKNHNENGEVNENLTRNQIKSDCSVDEIFDKYIGNFGKYQKLLSVFVCLIIAPLASSVVLSNLLVLLIVPHTCKYDASNITLSNETDLDSHFLPKKPGSSDFENCLMYDRSTINTINNSSVNTTITIKCSNGWKYDHNWLFETIVSENDWVCDEQWKALFSHSLFSIGMVFGSILVGVLSDAIGRVSTISVFFALAGISGIGTTFSVHNYVIFSACRIMLGFAAPVIAVPGVLLAEVVGAEKRFIALVGFFLSFSTFNGLFPWIAYIIGNWRVFNVTVSLLYFLVPVCSFFILESPRWLLSVGKRHKAEKIMLKIARVNGKSIPDTVITDLVVKKQSSAGIKSIFKYKQLLLMFSISSLIGFLYTMVFVSHNLFAANLSKHPFALLSIFACFDVFAAFLSRFLADYLGRKNSMIISCIISSVLYVATVIIPKDLSHLILISGLLARIGVGSMMNINSVYSPEIFPTVVRSRLISARMCFSALGTVISPLLVTYTFLGPNTPLFLFGVSILVCGLLMFLMPETLGKPLPETLEDGENLMKNNNTPVIEESEEKDEDEEIALSLTSKSLQANS